MYESGLAAISSGVPRAVTRPPLAAVQAQVDHIVRRLVAPPAVFATTVGQIRAERLLAGLIFSGAGRTVTETRGYERASAFPALRRDAYGGRKAVRRYAVRGDNGDGDVKVVSPTPVRGSTICRSGRRAPFSSCRRTWRRRHGRGKPFGWCPNRERSASRARRAAAR